MQKTYKCSNGHKFKKDETGRVTCPVCNETAEPVKWNSVDRFSNNSKGGGIFEELGSVVNEIPGASGALKVFGYLKVSSWLKK